MSDSMALAEINPWSFALPTAGFQGVNALAYLSAAADEGSRIVNAHSHGRPGEDFPETVQLASRLVTAAVAAKEALKSGLSTDHLVAHVAATTAIWISLVRLRSARERVPGDVQIEATAKAEERALDELRALALGGLEVKKAAWKPRAMKDYGLTGRGAERVWERGAREHPHIRALKGKTKTRR